MEKNQRIDIYISDSIFEDFNCDHEMEQYTSDQVKHTLCVKEN